MASLPNTGYAVLGILATGHAMSGYEVRKSAENLRYFYWSPAQSQIYSELKRLAKLDYVHSEYVPQDGKPDKRLYTITTAGRSAFADWLNHKPVDPTMMKHAMQLRLFFGGQADPDALRQLLTQFVAQADEALGQLAIVRDYAEMDPDFAWSGIVAEWSEAHYHSEAAFARTLIERLDRGEWPPAGLG